MMYQVTPQQLWNKCLSVIKDNVTEVIYSTWFAPIVPLKYESNELVLQVPSMFFYEYIDEKFAELLRVTIDREAGEGVRLLYRVMMDKSSQTTVDCTTTSPEPVITKSDSRATTYETTSPFRNIIPQDIDPQLNPTYSFTSYLEGTSNKLARTAGVSIAKDPGKTAFNPLFIYGQSGVGKTHLGHAIGIMTKQLHPEKRVLYVSAHLFQLQYVDAVCRNTTNDFVNFYQSLDVLIIDDIQEFMNKEKTQNTFFHIFNHLHQTGKQLILCSDRAPGMLKGMEDRLLTRFKWGLSAEIEQPSLQLRKAILQHKIYKDGLDIPASIVDYIAEHVSDNVRNLEGVLVSLLAHATLTDAQISLDLAGKVIGKVESISPKSISITQITQAVCEYFSLPMDDLKSKTRKREIAQARQIAMYLAKKYTKNSLSAIGKAIGNRDHSTVMHACSVVDSMMNTNKEIRMSVSEITELLNK